MMETKSHFVEQGLAVPKKRFFSPAHFFFVTLVSIFVAEACIMLLLYILPPLSVYKIAILDSLFLSVIVIPILYFSLLRPMILHVNNRKHAENELQKAHNELEQRVLERTEELGVINQKLQQEISGHRQTGEALRESEGLLRAVVQTAVDAIISANSSGIIISWNRGAQTIFGYMDEEVLGRPLTILIPERYIDAHIKGIERFRLTGEARVIGKRVELHGLRKDGRDFPLEMSLAIWKSGEENCYTGIIRDITAHKMMQAELEQLAVTDSLTQAYNRTKSDEIIDREMKRSLRHDNSLSLLLFDIDHFKNVNDTHGHIIGDYVLKTIADIVRENIRKLDYFIRWGGEEFIIFTPDTDLGGAAVLADRIRKAIEGYRFDKVERVTVSFGVTQFRKDDIKDSIIKRADDLLYIAKTNGRNRIEISG